MKELRTVGYEQRLNFAIMDLTELRDNKWVQKVMASKAKTKTEVRLYNVNISI